MWLLEQSVKQAIEEATRNGVAPTAEQQAQYEARYGAPEGGASRILAVAGDTAEITVEGVITVRPSFLAMLLGGGNLTYRDIVSALAEADADPQVKRAVLRVDSPGGHIDGLFDAIAAIQAFSKPLTAFVQNTAASAAYALVSQCGMVTAANRAVRVGSVGIVARYRVDESVVQVTSTQAPDKRPDVTTERGRATVREELDALHELFAEAIAAGRSATVEKVNADFGRGATILADEALKRGMIDAIAGGSSSAGGPADTSATAHAGGDNLETGTMNLAELKAQHPDVYTAAVQVGVDTERDRVSAHLTLGNASGDMKTALAAVEDGSGMTASLQAKYMAAGMNRSDQQNRQDDDAASAAADGAAGESGDGDGAAQVLAAVESRLGIDQEG